jgi:hypothetical protein
MLCMVIGINGRIVVRRRTLVLYSPKRTFYELEINPLDNLLWLHHLINNNSNYRSSDNISSNNSNDSMSSDSNKNDVNSRDVNRMRLKCDDQKRPRLGLLLPKSELAMSERNNSDLSSNFSRISALLMKERIECRL